ncbi:hypothetical protein SIID45300_01736 [Candidatus Magnetaquicoccaceae bacterium FCR-1]|uniref:Uncharacterized protein n=1 Tax=Candidatus Magnetaquiglobus chichijimensis TaxID=3141448 RepID=A0ABQ0C938_9PROT
MSFSISDFAPTLAKIVVGAVPGGDLALKGVRAVMNAFGVSSPEQVNLDDLSRQLDNPEIQLKFKEAERLLNKDLLEHAREMRALGLEEYKTQTADLADVRAMIRETHDRTPAILAYASLGGYIALAAAQLFMMSHGLVPQDPNLAMLMGQMMGDVRGYVSQTLAVFCGAVPPAQTTRKAA